MSVIANAKLIRTLLDHLPADAEIEVESFPGDRAEVLFGLREMLHLGLITGDFKYGELRDPLGPLLASASAIRLTRRGASLK